MNQKTENNKVFIVKISGPNIDFIEEIASTLRNTYTVVLASRPKPNDVDAGYHLFLTLLELEK